MVKNFICPHHRDKVLCLGKIDDVVGIAGKHVNGLYSFSTHLKFNDLVRPNLPFLNEAVTSDHNKELPLAVMPVLAFRDSRFGDIHRKLPMIRGFQQLGERTSIITVHLEIEGNLLFRKVGQIHGVKLLLEGTRRDCGHNQILRLIMEGVEKLNDATKCGFVSHRRIAITA